LFPQTIELVETHRLVTQAAERFSLDLAMPSDVAVEWPPTLLNSASVTSSAFKVSWTVAHTTSSKCA
jgi:hypothetical protein